MEENLLYTAIGMAIIFTASIGIANSLTISGVEPIGGSDDTIPPLDDIEIGRIQWQRHSGDYYRLRVQITNADTAAHTYEICTIWPDGASLSDDAGTSADCTISNNHNPGASRRTLIPVTNPTPAHDGTTYITFEKVS